MTTVQLNGNPAQLPEGARVQDLVLELVGHTAGIAVAVNDAVVPRSLWPTTPLATGDRVEILEAAQGG
jgi:sulfur carrier protein